MSDQDNEALLPVDSGFKAPMTLAKAWGIYAGSIALAALVVAFKWYGTLFLLYLVIGIVMSRVVMRQLVDFHPMYHTVAVEFSTKVRMVLFWPLQMFGLLFKLSANRVL